MSESHSSGAAHGADDSHDGPIRTPQQLIWTVVAAFVVPVVIIILLVNFVDAAHRPSAGSEGLSEEAVARRLERIGRVELRDPASAVLRTGEQVVQAQCGACHLTGAANAPKVGDAAAWAPRVKTGLDALVTAALKGKGAMGPQGGGDFSDFEITRAVVYLANQGGAKFDEPKPPAAAASAASAPK